MTDNPYTPEPDETPRYSPLSGLKARLASAAEVQCECGHYHPANVDGLEMPERDCGAWNCPCAVFRLRPLPFTPEAMADSFAMLVGERWVQ